MKKCSSCGDEKTLDHFTKRKASKDGYRNMCKPCMPKYKYELPKDNGPMVCIRCNIEKPFADFYATHNRICKPCQYIRCKKYKTQKTGALKALFIGAKHTAKTRKGDASVFNLEYQDMLDIYERQNGLCYYSKVKMTFDGQFKASIERLNNKLGYIKSNVVLCCLEFNGQCQWSLEKVAEMLHLLDQDIDHDLMNFDREIIDPNKIRTKRDYYESPRCKLKSLCMSAKVRCEKKKLNKTERILEYDLDFDFLVNLYNKQNGLCAYSGLPLKFGRFNVINWVVSLERIDVTRGYMKDNVCLICIEFNSTDATMNIKIKPTTSTGWTKDKFKYFVKSMKGELVQEEDIPDDVNEDIEDENENEDINEIVPAEDDDSYDEDVICEESDDENEVIENIANLKI